MHTIGYQVGADQKNYRDEQLSRPVGTGPFEQISHLVTHDPQTALVLYDDFVFDSTASWTTTKGTGGALAIASTVGGWVSIPTAASAANDYQVLSTGALFKLAAGGPIAFEAMVNVTEASTNLASWFVGLTSVTTTGFLSNAGAPAASWSGAIFWKATGALLLKAQTSNATVKHTSGTLATVVSAQTYILGMYLDPADGVTAQCTYYLSTISGVTPARSFVTSGTLALPIASLAAMKFALGSRTGSTSAESLTCDYVKVVQARILQ